LTLSFFTPKLILLFDCILTDFLTGLSRSVFWEINYDYKACFCQQYCGHILFSAAGLPKFRYFTVKDAPNLDKAQLTALEDAGVKLRGLK